MTQKRGHLFGGELRVLMLRGVLRLRIHGQIQHADNLDPAGRALVADEARVGRVVTTAPSARRLARPASTTRFLELGGTLEL
ncbi:hypothetical protein WMF45_42410 [Sorangium sp. So ce448]|uniref:hypothetical protein n=1 Tax=Sorangium sp. So ce448 TaxID=3133314 RepID=UPI003F62578B